MSVLAAFLRGTAAGLSGVTELLFVADPGACKYSGSRAGGRRHRSGGIKASRLSCLIPEGYYQQQTTEVNEDLKAETDTEYRRGDFDFSAETLGRSVVVTTGHYEVTSSANGSRLLLPTGTN